MPSYLMAFLYQKFRFKLQIDLGNLNFQALRESAEYHHIPRFWHDGVVVKNLPLQHDQAVQSTCRNNH